MSEYNPARKHPYAYQQTIESGSSYIVPKEVPTSRHQIGVIDTEIMAFTNRNDHNEIAILGDTEPFDQEESALKEGGILSESQSDSQE
mmetsp:Transcript_11916/g.18380  ORF Transcript_11916/g.18380 Transcript_11916/m.18380 type:complete len:88 (+) Transcript_11916:6-269(+)